MDMDANHMGLYTYVTEDNDIAMLDGGNDSQAFDSTPGSTLATTFDENNLRWLHDPELFQIELDSWFSEDGDIPLSGLEGAIRDTPTQTYNPVPNASSGNDGHGHQSEVVQAGLQADPDNTDVQNLEVDMDDDITSTVTTVDVTAPAQAQGLHSSSANPVGNPASTATAPAPAQGNLPYTAPSLYPSCDVRNARQSKPRALQRAAARGVGQGCGTSERARRLELLQVLGAENKIRFRKSRQQSPAPLHQR